MPITLKPHNMVAYEKVKEKHKENDKIAVIQPTGTGKMYIALKLIEDNKEKREIIELQKKYETNVIREEDLTETEKENLIKLYKEQIDTIENNIQTGLKELEFYKQKIIVAREKAKTQ